MVSGKPWYNFDFDFTADFDRHEKYHTDENFRNAVNEVASLGVCTFLPNFILYPLGFRMTGVFGGSLAAAWQSMIGNVPADSVFAFLQSAGAGGQALRQLEAMCQASMFTAAAGQAGGPVGGFACDALGVCSKM